MTKLRPSTHPQNSVISQPSSSASTRCVAIGRTDPKGCLPSEEGHKYVPPLTFSVIRIRFSAKPQNLEEYHREDICYYCRRDDADEAGHHERVVQQVLAYDGSS